MRLCVFVRAYGCVSLVDVVCLASYARFVCVCDVCVYMLVCVFGCDACGLVCA